MTMNQSIPTYPLSNLASPGSDELDVFLLEHKVDRPKSAVNIPFRSNYYGIGICTSGQAKLKANLETYTVEPGWLVVLSPQIIRQFVYRSDNYLTLSIFFTADFMANDTTTSIDRFPFFDPDAVHAFPLSPPQAELIDVSLQFIRSRYRIIQPFRAEILRSAITIALYELAGIYNDQFGTMNAPQTRSQSITVLFKKLLYQYALTQRSVTFYAQRLALTPNYLSETVKEVTGKTAGEWITNRVILEARVLLQNPSLSVAQIADRLNFADQSTFGKFFKKNTSISPLAYRLGK